MTIFGSIFTAALLEDAAIEHLKAWMPTYLAEMERQNGLDPESLPMIRSYTTLNEFDAWEEEQTPAIVVVSPGTIGEPLKEGGGLYRANWALGIGCIVSARDRVSTNRVAKLYGGAIRAAIMQHESMGGVAEGAEWSSERYDDVPSEASRTLAAAQLLFEVEVRSVLDGSAGPAEPLDDPYTAPADWGEVQTHDVQVTRSLA